MKWLVLIAFGGIGLATLAGGLLWGWNRLPLFQHGVHTTGTVAGQEETLSTRSGSVSNRVASPFGVINYNPIVEFTDANGENFRFVGSTGGGGRPVIETGSEVEVIYDPADPHQAQIASFKQFWLGPLVVTVCGLIFLLMGAGSFFLTRDNDRSMEELADMMQRERLLFSSEAPIVSGTIIRAEERPAGSGRYVFICRGIRPGGVFDEEFVSDFLPFDPGPGYRGRNVIIHTDPANQNGYFVNIDALLPEIMNDRSHE